MRKLLAYENFQDYSINLFLYSSICFSLTKTKKKKILHRLLSPPGLLLACLQTPVVMPVHVQVSTALGNHDFFFFCFQSNTRMRSDQQIGTGIAEIFARVKFCTLALADFRTRKIFIMQGRCHTHTLVNVYVFRMLQNFVRSAKSLIAPPSRPFNSTNPTADVHTEFDPGMVGKAG